MTTVPPSAARRSTVARPMPLAPPVTIATFPSKRATYISFRRGPQPLAPKTRVRRSNQSAEAPAPWTRLGSEEMGFGAPCRARAPGYPIIEAKPRAYEGRKYRRARRSGRRTPEVRVRHHGFKFDTEHPAIELEGFKGVDREVEVDISGFHGWSSWGKP